MVFLRIFVLVFLVAYSYSMGQYSSSGLNSFGRFVAASFFIWAPCLYLLPIYEAASRKHTNVTGIALVNVFLGLSLVGWIIAMVWAHKKQEVVPITAAPPAPVLVEGKDVIRDLERLSSLREKGMLTIEEFEAQKKALLGP